jgi:hypothetical protein
MQGFFGLVPKVFFWIFYDEANLEYEPQYLVFGCTAGRYGALDRSKPCTPSGHKNLFEVFALFHGRDKLCPYIRNAVNHCLLRFALALLYNELSIV